MWRCILCMYICVCVCVRVFVSFSCVVILQVLMSMWGFIWILLGFCFFFSGGVLRFEATLYFTSSPFFFLGVDGDKLPISTISCLQKNNSPSLHVRDRALSLPPSEAVKIIRAGLLATSHPSVRTWIIFFSHFFFLFSRIYFFLFAEATLSPSDVSFLFAVVFNECSAFRAECYVFYFFWKNTYHIYLPPPTPKKKADSDAVSDSAGDDACICFISTIAVKSGVGPHGYNGSRQLAVSPVQVLCTSEIYRLAMPSVNSSFLQGGVYSWSLSRKNMFRVQPFVSFFDRSIFSE